ncbi:F-box protein PP2-B10-like [Ziziphus jujuba]|uniref:F-box protein PP2-B10-like n=2 Tax=Ziziphus jujuba TaxID=326968 RepID=A0ABM4A469_ZIZJJ|nr:F-box protein PP2-B10-like [Ziziphus jujuba]
MSFKIDKENGEKKKKCYMIGSRRLSIAGHKPVYRKTSLPAESSFSRVAKLRQVWWLDIRGRIETNILSPKSTYGAYFVYKLDECCWAFKNKPVEFRVYFEGEEEVHEHEHGGGCKVFLDPSEDEQGLCQFRDDWWLEVEMGEFFNDGSEDNRVVVCSLMGTDNYISKGGLVVEGIEFRPKSGT